MSEHLVAVWAATLEHDNPKLRRQWVSVVRRAGRDNDCDPAELSGEQIDAWRAGFAAHAARCYGTPLRAWFRWLVDEGHRRDNPMVRRAPGPARRPATGVRLLDAWAQWMRAGGMRPRTVEERVRIVERAARASDAHPAEMTADHVTAWLAGCTNASTRATYYAAAKAWHRWLVDQGHRQDDPIRLLRAPRIPQGVPRPVDAETLEALLRHAHGWDRWLVLLGACAGLRVSEIAKVRGEDFDLDAGRLWVEGKGGVRKPIALHPELAAVAAVAPRRGPWFPSPADPERPMTRQWVGVRIARLAAEAGVRATAHQLRHWFGTSLVAAGSDTLTAQALLRHSSVATTQRYVAVSNDSQRRAVSRLRLPGAPVDPANDGQVDARALVGTYADVELLSVRQTRRLALELLAAADAAEAG